MPWGENRRKLAHWIHGHMAHMGQRPEACNNNYQTDNWQWIPGDLECKMIHGSLQEGTYIDWLIASLTSVEEYICPKPGSCVRL